LLFKIEIVISIGAESFYSIVTPKNHMLWLIGDIGSEEAAAPSVYRTVPTDPYTTPHARLNY
jgi:hypothetical protein